MFRLGSTVFRIIGIGVAYDASLTFNKRIASTLVQCANSSQYTLASGATTPSRSGQMDFMSSLTEQKRDRKRRVSGPLLAF